MTSTDIHPHRRTDDSSYALPFWKLSALGNDFAVVDLRSGGGRLSADTLASLGDRHHGVGCDLILTLQPPLPGADARFAIWTPDGRSSDQCGNGLRCVAHLLTTIDPAPMRRHLMYIDSPSRRHEVIAETANIYRTAMGPPSFADIRLTTPPTSADADRDSRPGEPRALMVDLFECGALRCTPVSVGNPHLVTFVESVADWDRFPLQTVARAVQSGGIFPEDTNVTVAYAAEPTHIIQRTYEFGAGETNSCASAACATTAIHIASLRQSKTVALTIEQPGGQLAAMWSGLLTDDIHITGPATLVYEGRLITR